MYIDGCPENPLNSPPSRVRLGLGKLSGGSLIGGNSPGGKWTGGNFPSTILMWMSCILNSLKFLR